MSGPRRPTSAHVRAAAPFAGHEDKKGTFEASVIVWNGASTIPAGSRVALRFVEAFGGIAPQSLAALHKLARRAKTKGSRDRTAYGSTRISTSSFLTHHTQRIVKNVVMYDALNIIEQVGCLKQRAHDMTASGVERATTELSHGSSRVPHTPC